MDKFRTLVDHTEDVELVKGTQCRDHIRICPGMAPKRNASKVVGVLKRESATMLLERHPESRFMVGHDRTFWARGYYAGIIGHDEEAVRKYVREQEGKAGEAG